MAGKRMTGTFGLVVGIIVASSLIVALPSAGLASRRSARDTALETARRIVAAGFDIRETYRSGLLRKGGRHVVRMTLYRGNEYALVGGGCRDCYDLDLILYDENWNQIDRDRMSDRVPIVTVRPRWSGTYYVVVEMYHSTPNGAHWVLLTGFR